MQWYIKCLVDDLKGILPAQGAMRRWKRQLFGYEPSTGRADYAIQEGVRLIQFIGLERVRDAVCLEMGCGWEPLLPILFSMAGARRVITTDLNRLLAADTVSAALSAIGRHREHIIQTLRIGPSHFDAQMEQARKLSFGEQLKFLRIEYLAPCDCAALPLRDQSLDVCFSRDTLEHIPPPILARIFAESRRVLKSGGLACHFVDPSDHWQHRDRSISRVNFLRYSDRMYRLTYINRLNYHNRLRHSEYLALLKEAGFEIVREERNVDKPALQALSNGALMPAPKWAQFDPEDLATVDSFLLAKPA